jgi:hypothetical protein
VGRATLGSGGREAVGVRVSPLAPRLACGPLFGDVELGDPPTAFLLTTCSQTEGTGLASAGAPRVVRLREAVGRVLVLRAPPEALLGSRGARAPRSPPLRIRARASATLSSPTTRP